MTLTITVPRITWRQPRDEQNSDPYYLVCGTIVETFLAFRDFFCICNDTGEWINILISAGGSCFYILISPVNINKTNYNSADLFWSHNHRILFLWRYRRSRVNLMKLWTILPHLLNWIFQIRSRKLVINIKTMDCVSSRENCFWEICQVICEGLSSCFHLFIQYTLE